MKKRYDPLWEVVDEKVSLQGSEKSQTVVCPRCHVRVELPARARAGTRFRCGLCGTLCEVAEGVSVAHDGTTEIATRLAE